MEKTFIIAEAGVNHNGSIKNALQLVDKAAEAGADAIKFQTFQASKLATVSADKAAYQKRFTDKDESQQDMLKKLEITESDHVALADRCREKHIEFISSPFDRSAVDLLVRCGVQRIKIPSGEITNGPLLLRVAATSLPCIVSTGMATIAEIETALAVLAFGYKTGNDKPERTDFYKRLKRSDFQILQEKVTLLHCTSMYPTPHSNINLRCMETLRSAFGLSVGLSDHSVGVEVPVAAVALGAEVIEKHFTLSRTMDGPDHKASLEPDELKVMISMIRNVEDAMGSPFKYPVDDEFDTRAVARKGLVASRKIKRGEVFGDHNLDVKRPEAGLSPMMYWNLIGRKATRDYIEDELINELLDTDED